MILVTGGTGLSGTFVVREFSRQGVPVRALFRKPDTAGHLFDLPGVEPVQGDMLRPETLTDAFKGVARVLMISSPRERMVETQNTFVDAAKAAGVPHIVKFSGKEAGVGFDQPAFRGMRAHLEIEDHLERSGLAWTHLRPSQFMQLYLPGGNYGYDPATRELRLPHPGTRLTPIDIEDIARIAVAVLTTDGHEGKAYEMSGPEALTMQEVVERLSLASGVRHSYVEVSIEEKVAEYRRLGYPEPALLVMDDILRERSRHVDSHVWLDAHRTFGVTPTSFLDFARRNRQALLG